MKTYITAIVFLLAPPCFAQAAQNQWRITSSGHSASSRMNTANIDVSRISAVEPPSSDYIFYVSSNGSDSNDGRSWGSAFRTVYHALAECPFNNGCTYYLSPGSAGQVTIGGPVSGQGIWLTNDNDYYFNPISAISRTGNVVTATLGANGQGINFWSVGKVIDVFNVNGGRTSFDGTGFTILAVSGNTISWAQKGANESGAVSRSSYLVPTGFLFADKYQIIGVASSNVGATSTWASQVQLIGNSTTDVTKPALFIADDAEPGHFENIALSGASAMWLGVSSERDSKVAGATGQTFKNVSFSTAERSGTGPTVWIAGNSFEDYFHDCAVNGNIHGTTPGSDAATDILIRTPAIGSEGGGSGNGDFSFWNLHLTGGGGLKYYQNSGTPGTIYVNGILTEALSAGTPAIWFPIGGANGSLTIQASLKNILVADSNNTPEVEVDISQNSGLITVEETNGSSIDVVGPLTVLGSQNELGTSTVAPEWSGQAGIWSGNGSLSPPLLIGRRFDLQRNFSPVAARFLNLASTSSTGWVTVGKPRITSGVPDPDGNSNAYHVTASGSAYVQPYSHTVTPAAGDWAYFGGWIRSTTGNAFASTFTWVTACTQITSNERFSNGSTNAEEVQKDYRGTTEWHYYADFFKVTRATGSPCTFTLETSLDATHSIDVYAPMLIYIPAASALSDNEMATYFSYLAPYGNNAPVGSIAGLPGQTWAFPGSTQFYGLLTHSNTTNQTYRFPNVTGTIAIQTQPMTGSTYSTASNCSSSTSPAVCGSAAAGNVVIAAGATTVTVDTTALTANSQIFVQADATLSAKLGVTCNSALSVLTGGLSVTLRTAGVSFQISNNGTAPSTHPLCISYHIVN